MRRINNRFYVLAAMMIAAMVMLCGCGGGASGEVYVYSYGDYFDPAIIDEFESETGIRVVVDTYDTAGEMYTVIENGATTYDAICTSDYMIEKMIAGNMLSELDKSNIPDLGNIGQIYMEKSEIFDPGNKYSVPYQVGTAGIIYNTKMVGDVEIDSWDDLWNEKFADQLVMPDSVRDAFMIALKKLGYSENSTNEAEIRAAAEELENQKSMVYKYDSWVVPESAANKENAEKWINFLCKAETAATNFDYLFYTTPNEAAYELIDKEYLEDEAIFPTEETISRCESLRMLDDKTTELYSNYWKEVKAK